MLGLRTSKTLNQSYESPLELQAHNLVTVGTDRPLEITVAQTLKALMQQTDSG
jgi:hypothetical protein